MNNIKFDFTNNNTEYLLNIKNDIFTKQNNTYDSVVSIIDKRTYNNTILPLINIVDYCSVLTNCIVYIVNFHTLKKMRDCASNIQTDLEKHGIELSMRTDMFNAFIEYYNGYYIEEKKDLSNEQNKYIERSYINYKKMGMYLSEDEKSEVKKIQQKIAELSNDFSNNLNNDETKLIFTKEELIGVPDSWFESHKPICERESGNHSYEFTLKYHDKITIMETCECRETRKTMMTYCALKCNRENSPLFNEIIKLRTLLANKLGFESFADYNCTLNILNTSNKIIDFENEIAQIIEPQYTSVINNLKMFAINHSNNVITDLQKYDLDYYNKQYIQQHCNFNIESCRKYFPLNHVKDRMFELFQNILGLKFYQIDNENIWDKSVQTYKVVNTNDESIVGYFYLDFFPRDGKYDHFAVFQLADGFDTTNNINYEGNYIYPTGCIVCNFPENESLKFEDVVTLFHEFGHLMHLLCSKAKLSSNGSFHVSMDFVETPSQLFEFWCYVPSVLKYITKHVDTNEPIDDESIDKIIKSNKINKSLFYQSQIFLGMIDMKIHSLKNEDFTDTISNEIYTSTYKNILKFEPISDSNGFCVFGHLVAGYEAGYYSYLRSEAYSANLYFEMFKGNEFNIEVGNKYRKEVLEKGSTMNEIVIMENFLGKNLNDKFFIDKIR